MFKNKSFFFCAVGGSGMLPLALLIKSMGNKVCGSDRAYDQGSNPSRFSFIKTQNIKMYKQDGSGVTSDIDFLVVSGAVENTVLDYQFAIEKNIPVITRAQLLSDVFNETKERIGVAGTSGKSTVTAMIGWIFSCACDIYKTDKPTIINGATMKNFVTDEMPVASFYIGDNKTIIAEIDESDGSIEKYNPTISVINNIANDHKTMEELRVLFSDYANRSTKTILNLDNLETEKIAKIISKDKKITFSTMRADADLLAMNIERIENGTKFDLVLNTACKTYPVSINLIGDHNVSNVLASLSVAIAANIDIEFAIDAIEYFNGISRRYDIIGVTDNNITIIDDFAHNPDKISATLKTAHQKDGRVLVLYQPHGFSPLSLLRKELSEAFAKGLNKEDILIICDPVYFGGTIKREVTSEDIVKDIISLGKTAKYIANRDNAVKEIIDKAEDGDKIIIMGARDDSLTIIAKDILKQL